MSSSLQPFDYKAYLLESSKDSPPVSQDARDLLQAYKNAGSFAEMRIMLLEDERSISEPLTAILTHLGATVDVFEDIGDLHGVAAEDFNLAVFDDAVGSAFTYRQKQKENPVTPGMVANGVTLVPDDKSEHLDKTGKEVVSAFKNYVGLKGKTLPVIMHSSGLIPGTSETQALQQQYGFDAAVRKVGMSINNQEDHTIWPRYTEQLEALLHVAAQQLGREPITVASLRETQEIVAAKPEEKVGPAADVQGSEEPERSGCLPKFLTNLLGGEHRGSAPRTR